MSLCIGDLLRQKAKRETATWQDGLSIQKCLKHTGGVEFRFFFLFSFVFFIIVG